MMADEVDKVGTADVSAPERRRGITAFDVFMAFNATILIGSTAYAYATAELEFGLYAAVILGMGLLIWRFLRCYHYPLWMLALMQIAIFAHFAGGFIYLGPDHHSLYYHEFFGVRFDKIVHTFNSGVAALVLASIFRQAKMRLEPMEAFVVIGMSTALGAATEILEYFAVMTIPNTGVGDYVNTVEDLMMNVLGATLGYVLWKVGVALSERRSEGKKASG